MRCDYVEAPEYIGVMAAASILKDPVVQDFVKRVREREGIEPPSCRADLEYNCRQHDLLAFVQEALPIADDHLGQAIFSDLPEPPVDQQAAPEARDGVAPEALDLAITSADAGMALPGPLGAFLEILMGVLKADEAVSAAARVISRFIVAGYLEPPEPIPSTAVGIGVLGESEGGPYTLAFIAPWANLEEGWRRIVAMHRGHHAGRKRMRVPDKAIETLWLRFCLQDMGRDPDSETGYTAAAELSFEVWPLTKPKHPEGSQRYEAAVRRWADKIRKRSRQWEKWRDVMFA